MSPTSRLCAGSEQVDHIQVIPNVDEDLQLRHQSFALIRRGSACESRSAALFFKQKKKRWWNRLILKNLYCFSNTPSSGWRCRSESIKSDLDSSAITFWYLSKMEHEVKFECSAHVEQKTRIKNTTQHWQMKCRRANLDHRRSRKWNSFFFFGQSVFYDLRAKAAVESPAKPWSIWRNLLLSIKPDLGPVEPLLPSGAHDLCPGVMNGVTATAPFYQRIHLLARVIYQGAMKYSVIFYPIVRQKKKKTKNSANSSLIFSLKWDPLRFHRRLFSTVRTSVVWQRQTCFYFKMNLNCTLLNSVWPAGFGQADRSGWICASSLPSSQARSEPSPLAALCQEQIMHALPYANAPCEQKKNT